MLGGGTKGWILRKLKALCWNLPKIHTARSCFLVLELQSARGSLLSIEGAGGTPEEEGEEDLALPSSSSPVLVALPGFQHPRPSL